MLKLRKTAAVLLSACLTAPAVQALPDIEHWTNGDGIPVYFVHTSELPMLDVKVLFKAGSAHDGQTAGVAALAAALLKKGARDKNVEQINDALNNLAANYGAGAGDDTISLSLRSLSDADTLNQSLELFIEIVSQPVFPADEFEHAKRKRLLQLRTQDEDPAALAGRIFRENVYAGHVYAQANVGTEESLQEMRLDDVRRYYQTYFVRANMIIVAVGAVSRQEMDAISQRISSAFEQGQQAPETPAVEDLQIAETIAVPFPSDQAHVKIGQPFIEAGHPDFFALRLGNHILGGGSFGSRIMDEVRVKRGLAYSAYSQFDTKRQAGTFSVNFQTRVDQVPEAIQVVQDILEDFIENGPSDEEVALSLANIRGGFALNLGSNSALLGIVSKIARHNLGVDYLNNYLKNFDELDAQKVHSAFKRHLHPDKLVTVTVGGDG